MRKLWVIVAATAFVLGANVMTTTASQAVAWSRCKACHNFDASKKVGPGWKGIYGREAGIMPGFKYKFTKYIKPGKRWKWDDEHIRAWDCNSAKAIKEFTGDPNARTKMPPQHVCDKADQDAIIAFMKTLK